MVRASVMHNDRATARRSAILAIAGDIFLREGYSAASMSDIAERLGGSKGTLYNYFPSKKELFLAVVEERAERALEHIEPLPSGERAGEHGGELRSILRRVGVASLKHVLDEQSVSFYRLVISEGGRFPEVGTLFYTQLRSRFVSPLAEQLQQEIEAGRLPFRDYLEAGELFYDLCSASPHRRALMGIQLNFGPADIEARVERAVDMFLSICQGHDGDGRTLDGPESGVASWRNCGQTV